MIENEKNQKRLEYLIEEAFDDMELEEMIEEKKVEFSAEHNKKIEKLLHRVQRRRTIKIYNDYLKKSVAILIIVFVVIGALTFCVEANRIKFLNFIIEYTDKYTEIRYNNNMENENNIDERDISNSSIELKYIPNGFSLKRGEESDLSIYMFFENEDKFFMISGNTEEGVIHIDTEEAEVRNININKKECMFVKKDNVIRIYWTNNKMSFLLAGNIEEKEMIDILKGIK